MRILFLLMIYLQYAFSSIVATDTTIKYTDSIPYLHDEKSTLTINEIVNENFIDSVSSQFTLGYRDDNVWFKVAIENKSENSDFVLFFSEPFWAEFDLYEPVKDGWIKHKNGLLTPLKERHIEELSPVFHINVYKGESKTYYIKGQTVNGQLGELKLYTEKEFFRPSRLTLSDFYLFYSGILFIIIVLNFFLFTQMKERIYAYYIGYVLSFFVFISMFSGSYLCLGIPPWNQGLHTVGTIVLTFMTLFSVTLLELDKYFPIIDKILKSFAGIFIVFGILISLDTPYIALIFNILSATLLTILLVLAIKTWLLGKIKIRYYLIALMIYMPTMGLMVLTFNGLIDNTNFSRYIFLLGALIEIVFFSLILAKRFHTAKDEKIHFQNELLHEKQKNEQFLKSEIEKQHQEIKEKTAILLQQSRHAEMGEMISMIAHQWRQPLTAISSLAGTLQIKIAMNTYEKDFFNERLKEVSSFSQHLSSTIEDFRNFFQLNKEKNIFNLQLTINKALKLNDSLFKRENISVETHLDSGLEIKSFENELIQVFLNIFKNSQDALVEKNIQEPKIIINLFEDADKNIKITIEDNAGGVPNEIATKIFEPYFSTKSKNGTGLGLYMSKTIIEEHCNGDLFFNNTDVGACFTILLRIDDSTN